MSAFRELGLVERLNHVTELGLQGRRDTAVIPYCAENNYVLVTEDQNIRRNPLEVEALQQSSIGFVEVKVSNKSTLIQRHLVYATHAEKLAGVVKKKTPFCYVMTRTDFREENVRRIIRKKGKAKK